MSTRRASSPRKVERSRSRERIPRARGQDRSLLPPPPPPRHSTSHHSNKPSSEPELRGSSTAADVPGLAAKAGQSHPEVLHRPTVGGAASRSSKPQHGRPNKATLSKASLGFQHATGNDGDEQETSCDPSVCDAAPQAPMVIGVATRRVQPMAKVYQQARSSGPAAADALDNRQQCGAAASESSRPPRPTAARKIAAANPVPKWYGANARTDGSDPNQTLQADRDIIRQEVETLKHASAEMRHQLDAAEAQCEQQTKEAAHSMESLVAERAVAEKLQGRLQTAEEHLQAEGRQARFLLECLKKAEAKAEETVQNDKLRVLNLLKECDHFRHHEAAAREEARKFDADLADLKKQQAGEAKRSEKAVKMVNDLYNEMRQQKWESAKEVEALELRAQKGASEIEKQRVASSETEAALQKAERERDSVQQQLSNLKHKQGASESSVTQERRRASELEAKLLEMRQSEVEITRRAEVRGAADAKMLAEKRDEVAALKEEVQRLNMTQRNRASEFVQLAAQSEAQAKQEIAKLKEELRRLQSGMEEQQRSGKVPSQEQQRSGKVPSQEQQRSGKVPSQEQQRSGKVPSQEARPSQAPSSAKVGAAKHR